MFVAITAGDVENIELARGHGMNYVTMPNNPVGNKMQAALDLAMDAGCERMLILGSDDFVSPEWVGRCLESSSPFIAPDRAAVHHPVEGTYLIRAGKKGASHGAARCVHRSAVEKAGGLWRMGRDRALDSESMGRLLAAGVKCTTIIPKGIPVVDVKSGVNIWPFRTWKGSGHRCSSDEALWMVSDSIRARLPLTLVRAA